VRTPQIPEKADPVDLPRLLRIGGERRGEEGDGQDDGEDGLWSPHASPQSKIEMVQHSSEAHSPEDAISVDTLVSMRPSHAILEPMRDASCGGPAALAQDRRDLAPAIEAAQ